MAPRGEKRGFPDKYTHLEVLPASIGKDEMKDLMVTWSRSLGVRCDHCHQQGDFAAETRVKQAARSMFQLTAQINRDVFNWNGAPRATCFMCHHGEARPTLAPPPLPPHD